RDRAFADELQHRVHDARPAGAAAPPPPVELFFALDRSHLCCRAHAPLVLHCPSPDISVRRRSTRTGRFHLAALAPLIDFHRAKLTVSQSASALREALYSPMARL